MIALEKKCVNLQKKKADSKMLYKHKDFYK